MGGDRELVSFGSRRGLVAAPCELSGVCVDLLRFSNRGSFHLFQFYIYIPKINIVQSDRKRVCE
jgi:hypothetical protein